MNRISSVVLTVVFLSASVISAQPGGAPDWQSKVDPLVLISGSHDQTEFIVFLGRQADLTGASQYKTKIDKGRFVVDQLRRVARETQKPILDDLAARGVEARPYWIANMIWVHAGLDVVQSLAERSDVAHIFGNPWVLFNGPVESSPSSRSVPETVEWGVSKIRAPQVWAAGFNGMNVVVGGQDTGYDWTHPAIKNAYRGWNGSAADHNYNWHDSIHSGGGVCGANAQAPCDDQGHGTHTMGTMVGLDGANQIGVAPGAKWMGCRNMNVGAGTPTTYSECFQWFIAPTDLNNLNPDPTKSPDVINNSWGCPPSEGCTALVLQTVVENTRAAGIVVVVSAGNSGSGCGSVSDPPAIYDASFSVGATDSSDTIASFSSRGAVTIDGSNRLKPDISAPGVSVRSSIPGGGYASYSGTSMAGPHVVGATALIMSAQPSLKGDVSAVETLFEGSAVPKTTSENCGGIPGSQVPNNTYGYGRIDAYTALQRLNGDLNVLMTDSPDPLPPGGTLVYTITVTNQGVATAPDTTLDDNLPNVTFVSATSTIGSCGETSNHVTCSIGALSPFATATVTITVQTLAAGILANNASASSSQLDLDPGDNIAAVQTTVCTPPSAPAISAPLSVAPQTPGYTASATNHAGNTYNWTLTGGTITGGQGMSTITFTSGNPGVTMQLGLTETSSGCGSAYAPTKAVQVDFLDVPPSSALHDSVNTIARNGITAGCGGGYFCPSRSITRAQMAVFLLRARYGVAYAPPAATGTYFTDVPADSFAAAWIEELFRQGVASGCGGSYFCPSNAVTRAQNSVMLLRMKNGSSYVPPAAAGIFGDVPVGSPYAPWIEELYNEGVTAGCSSDPLLFCPTSPNTRGQTAVFLTLVFGLN